MKTFQPEFFIITGVSGSGKSFYAKNKNPVLHYDTIFNYKTSELLYHKIDEFLEKYKECSQLYLDAFNKNLLEYIKNKYTSVVFKVTFIYISLDEHYEILAIKDPRDFVDEYDLTYDNYLIIIKKEVEKINEIVKNMLNQQIISNVEYLYRKGDKYKIFNDDSHLNKTINKTKKEIALKYIDKTSGHSSYQSIILDGEYIKKGSEKDWITFENILQCTELKNKIIYDTGCFNGYFSFQCLSQKCKKVVGVDHNQSAINICNKLCIWNNLHQWRLGKKKDISCECGIEFHLKKIGQEEIFSENADLILALNYLHHLKNELGENIFINVLKSFFSQSKEIIFEVNEAEIVYIEKIAAEKNFTLNKKIESHRKTIFGNRWILHYIKN